MIIGGVIAALVGTGALAAKHRFNGDRSEYMTNRIAERLDLNETQKQSFGEVAKKFTEIRGAQPEFMMELKGKLTELAADDTLTVEEVNTLKTEIKAEFDRRADIIIPEFVSFYNTLDNEQRAEVVARLEHMGDRFGKRGGKRDGKRGYWGGKGHHKGDRN